MTDFEWVAAVVVAVVSVARTVRLLIYDEFPPVAWARAHLVALLPEGSKWALLAQCQFCLAPYLVLGMGLWMWLSGLDTIWWVINGGWAAAYAAAIVVSFDQPSEE